MTTLEQRVATLENRMSGMVDAARVERNGEGIGVSDVHDGGPVEG